MIRRTARDSVGVSARSRTVRKVSRLLALMRICQRQYSLIRSMGAGAGPRIRAPSGGRPMASAACLGSRSGRVLVLRLQPHEGQTGGGRVGEGAPKHQFLREEGIDIVVARKAHRRVVGVVGLDEDPPRTVAASGPAGNLGQELKRPLARAKVRQVEERVGGDDAGEGDPGKVVALGDHLGPDEDLGISGGEGSEGPFEAVPAAHGVAVEDHGFDIGVELGQVVGHLLGAGADGVEELSAARGTLGGDDLPVAAVVAPEVAGSAGGRPRPPSTPGNRCGGRSRGT